MLLVEKLQFVVAKTIFAVAVAIILETDVPKRLVLAWRFASKLHWPTVQSAPTDLPLLLVAREAVILVGSVAPMNE